MRPLAAKALNTIALDGAYQTLAYLKIPVQKVFGDFDSLDQQNQQYAEQTTFIHTPDQNFSDFEKCLMHLQQNNPEIKTILLYGMSGGRTDHQFTNYSIAAKYASSFDFYFQDSYGSGIIISGQFKRTLAELPEKQLVSILPLPEATGVTTRGLKWDLQDARLKFNETPSLSNECLENTFDITLDSGALLVYLASHKLN